MTKSRIPSPSKADIKAIADRAEGIASSPATDAKGETVSVDELHRLTGYDRGTIRDWIDDGLPAGTGSRGIPYSINVRAFIEWRVAQAVAKAKPALPSGGMEWMGLTKPKEIFAAQLAMMKAAAVAKELVPRQFVLDLQARVLNSIRVAIGSLPNRLYREKSGFPPEQVLKWRAEAEDICLAALKSAQEDIDRQMKAVADLDDEVEDDEAAA